MVPGWATLTKIKGALARFERNLGWERPTLHGVGFPESADEIGFVRASDREHLLAAAVLATVAGRLDELLRRVADDEIAHVIIAPPDLAWLYAPYDGGADVLLAPALRDNLRDRHREWLSENPSGPAFRS